MKITCKKQAKQESDLLRKKLSARAESKLDETCALMEALLDKKDL